MDYELLRRRRRRRRRKKSSRGQGEHVCLWKNCDA